MRTIRLAICYDGSGFAGWQRQPQQPTVRTIQGELERAVEKITGRYSSVIGSGRTDAGVHALYQVAAFSTDSMLPPEQFVPAINAGLPPTIRILSAQETTRDFHPIRDVVRKRYRYLFSDSRPANPFLRPYVWFVLKRFDVEKMRIAMKSLLGKQDFAAFETTGSPRTTTVRTVFDINIDSVAAGGIFSSPKERDEFLSGPQIGSLEIEADGFLYNMVRAMVGTLVAIGQGRVGFRSPDVMQTILQSRLRSQAGPTAPAHGLFMIDVVYPNERIEKSPKE